MARSMGLTRLGASDLSPAGRRASFLSPMAPEQAAAKLDTALHGERKPFHITVQMARGPFVGDLQGPAFWVQSRTATLNPLERRLEGILAPCGGSTEVRCELKLRPAAVGGLLATVAMLALLTVVLVPIAVVAGGVLPFGLGNAAMAIILSLLAGTWLVLAGCAVAARMLARQGEERVADFVATVLDAPTTLG